MKNLNTGNASAESGDSRSARLWSRDFFLLWQGQVVSQVGDAIYMLAVFWFCYRETDSPLATGLVMTFAALPYVLLGAFAGRLIDRVNRKHVIVACDFARGAIIMGVFLLAHTGKLEVWHIYVTAVLVSSCSVFFNPCVVASIPRLVSGEHLIRANSLGEISRGVSATISPLVGGALIASIGVPAAFLVNAISFLLSAFSEIFISSRSMLPLPASDRSRDGLLATLREMKTFVGVLPLMGASLITNFFGMAVVLIPIFVAGVHGKDSVEFGMLSACVPMGTVLGLVFLSVMGRRFSKERAMPVALLMFGAGYVTISIWMGLWVLMPALAVLGICAALSRTSYVTVMQERIDSRMHGRAFGVILSADTGLQPLSYLVTGAMVQFFSLSKTLFVYGLGVLVCSVWVWTILILREKRKD